MALIRSFLLAIGVYGLYALCFPEWSGEAYHVMVLSVIAGGAVGVWALDKILDLGSGAGKIGIELGFLVAVALFLGYTMPQKSGKAPFEQWAEGARPNRTKARQGLERLKINPNGPVASRLVDLFPR
ncbi:MAG: hypothetical protein M0D55_11715 [Elusimicrobiota bacterium]|nr:MAG: hypothetical protein M0D55_11715 [Elusimicrobiota bacterium]